jgi:hypothetical protein
MHKGKLFIQALIGLSDIDTGVQWVAFNVPPELMVHLQLCIQV